MRMLKKGFLYLHKILYLICSLLIRCITTVQDNYVVCWSYSFKNYSCNPRYIAEYLSNKYKSKYNIYWVQFSNTNLEEINQNIKYITPYSLKYFIIINSAKLIITNSRTYLFSDFWIKRKKQKYIMTWHATMGLKRVEKDVEPSLPVSYVKAAKRDSKNCDLMISGCKYYSNIFRKSFWYNGEILEKGNPRNDIFFISHKHLKSRIFKQYNIPYNSKLILYAPTFRNDYKLCYYKINWDRIIADFNKKFDNNYYVGIRLHPNFKQKSKDEINDLLNHERVINLTNYPDIQNLLCISDILITDYSSSMFDFGIMKKICFIYATDLKNYERGFELNPKELPFPISTSEEELSNCILKFDYLKYKNDLDEFNKKIGIIEKGNACQEVCNWINNNIS